MTALVKSITAQEGARLPNSRRAANQKRLSREGLPIDRKLYELIYIRVSLINGCRYCTQHHVTSSKRVGLTPEDWAALNAGDYSRFDDKARTALTYAEKLTRAPQSITDTDFATLRGQFSEPEIVDLHLLTGLANLTNRFTDPLGLELEFPQQNI